MNVHTTTNETQSLDVTVLSHFKLAEEDFTGILQLFEDMKALWDALQPTKQTSNSCCHYPPLKVIPAIPTTTAVTKTSNSQTAIVTRNRYRPTNDTKCSVRVISMMFDCIQCDHGCCV